MRTGRLYLIRSGPGARALAQLTPSSRPVVTGSGHDRSREARPPQTVTEAGNPLSSQPCPGPSRRRRWTELALIFVVAPALVSVGPRWWVLPAILGAGALALALLLADPTFPRRRLLGAGEARRAAPAVFLRAVAVCAGIFLLALALRGPGALFLLPRTHPRVWVAICLLYPLASVYPQELMFRTLFFHRYGPLFPRPGAALAANAVLFGWAHVIVHDATAMAITTIGGVLLASTYQRSRSTLLVALEHAIYGDFVFSVGIGGMFVNGLRLMSKVLG
jgi:hypothetical protein